MIEESINWENSRNKNWIDTQRRCFHSSTRFHRPFLLGLRFWGETAANQKDFYILTKNLWKKKKPTYIDCARIRLSIKFLKIFFIIIFRLFFLLSLLLKFSIILNFSSLQNFYPKISIKNISHISVCSLIYWFIHTKSQILFI